MHKQESVQENDIHKIGVFEIQVTRKPNPSTNYQKKKKKKKGRELTV